MNARRFAVVTGASSGIGLELARLAAREGFDLLIVAEETAIARRAAEIGPRVRHLQVDLATSEGVERVVAEVGHRPIDLLAANAGRALGHDFLEQNFTDIRKMLDTNVTGTLELLHHLLPGMVQNRAGRVLITGSIAGFMTGPGLAAYNATKAFLNLFSESLREELRDTGVTVTCLQPGATETPIFRRAGLADSPIGRQSKDDPAEVAEAGFRAAMAGEASVVSGWKNTVLAFAAQHGPSEVIARAHRRAVQTDS